MSAGVAPSPSICWRGSPGTRWMSRKTSDTTSQTTGSVRARRVRICFMGSISAYSPGLILDDDSAQNTVRAVVFRGVESILVADGNGKVAFGIQRECTGHYQVTLPSGEALQVERVCRGLEYGILCLRQVTAGRNGVQAG